MRAHMAWIYLSKSEYQAYVKATNPDAVPDAVADTN
jgi:hypothetical protein